MALIEPSVNNNTITKLNELKINVVDTYATFNQMQQANKVNDNELYFIQEERTVDEIVIPLTYHPSGYYYVTSADFNNLDLDAIYEHPDRCVLNIEKFGYVDINNFIYNSSASVNLIAKAYGDIVSGATNFIQNATFYIEVLPNNSPYIDIDCKYGYDDITGGYPGKALQIMSNSSYDFPILMSEFNSNDSSSVKYGWIYRDTGVTINPSTNSINADQFNGTFNGFLAGTAISAYDFYYPKTITLTGSVSGSGSGGNSSNSTGWSINTTIVPAGSSTIGGIRIGYQTSGQNYGVQLTNNYQAYVNVPWTDTNIYHTTGNWNGFTYTAETIGSSSSVDQLSMTLPVYTTHQLTGTYISNSSGGFAQSTALTVSPSDHTHNIELSTGDQDGYVKIAGENIKVKGINTAAYHSYYDFAERDHKHGFEIPITYNSTTGEYEISDSTITVQQVFNNAGNCYISSSEYGYIETTYSELYYYSHGTHRRIRGKAYIQIWYGYQEYIIFEIIAAPNARSEYPKLSVVVYEGVDELLDQSRKVIMTSSGENSSFPILFHGNASPSSEDFYTPKFNYYTRFNPYKQLISTGRLKVNLYAGYSTSLPSDNTDREAGELFFKLI